MADTNVRSEAVDVEQIMRQIRARVREKRGAEYTDAELQQLASAKLDRLLDPRGTRSALVTEFRKRSTAGSVTDFSEEALYATHRPWLRSMRRLLNPILKLFINPIAFSRAMQARHEMDGLVYEVVQSVVLELTRLNLEVHSLKMRLESLSARSDFDERRAKAFENVPPSRPVHQDRPRRQGQPGPQGPSPEARSSGQSAPSGPPSQWSAPSQPAPASQMAPAAQTSPSGPAVPAGPSGQSSSAGQMGSSAPAGSVSYGGSVPGDGSQTNVGGGEPRRRRRRRRRRRGGQGQPGQHGQPGQQGQQGQGQQGQQGQGSPQPGDPQNRNAPQDIADGPDDGGDEWDDADGGASDQ